MDDNTSVYLTAETQSEIEDRDRTTMTFFVALITAISTAITAIVAVVEHL